MARVLVVDDERDVVELVKFLLERDGHQVIEAYNGREALEKAYAERDPQLVYLKAGRRFEPLRKDPRFGQFVRRIGLPE